MYIRRIISTSINYYTLIFEITSTSQVSNFSLDVEKLDEDFDSSRLLLLNSTFHIKVNNEMRPLKGLSSQ